MAREDLCAIFKRTVDFKHTLNFKKFPCQLDSIISLV